MRLGYARQVEMSWKAQGNPTSTTYLPAAQSTNMSLHVGLWAFPQLRYEQKKLALQEALSTYGTNDNIAVFVGSEDL